MSRWVGEKEVRHAHAIVRPSRLLTRFKRPPLTSAAACAGVSLTRVTLSVLSCARTCTCARQHCAHATPQTISKLCGPAQHQ